MTFRKRDPRFEQICEVAAFRAGIALRTVEALLPQATPRMKKRIANKILQWTDGRDRTPKITENVVRDMILRNSQCLLKECPMLLFTEPLVRELNHYFSEEDG
jgi:hypothetical protein